MASDLRKANRKSVEAYLEFGDILKHSARYILWLPEVRTLRSSKRRFLKYFTLPGRWAWDIFFFERNNILEREGRGFPNVRFCDNNVQSYFAAKRLLGNTIGKKGNFEDLVLNNGKEFWDGFPYDVYNLDFCGTCFPDKQPPFSRTFEAITRIIENHVTSNHFPFILLLTMKALASETRDEAKEELKENIENNRRDPNFKEQIDSIIPNTDTFVQRHFHEFIIISIPKVICHLADTHCGVEIRYRAKYPRDNAAYYITKFVFKFSRRRRRSLSIMSPMYISNIQKIMSLHDVILIDRSCINNEIRQSHRQLRDYVRSLEQGLF
jgi:hypothetical protein